MNHSSLYQQPPAEKFSSSETFYNSSHFSQATFANNTLWLSGKPESLQETSAHIAPDEEARLALQNLVSVLDAARDAVAGIVTLTTHPMDSVALRKFVARTPALHDQVFPAWSAVGAAQVGLPGIVVEVKVTRVEAGRQVQASEI